MMQIPIPSPQLKQLVMFDLEAIKAKPALDLEPRLRGLREHTRYLTQLQDDLRREEYYGIESIYCVDFSELRAYLHPLETDDPIALKAALVLEKSPKRMILPVGALYELIMYLNYLIDELSKKRGIVESQWDQFRNSSKVQEFMNSIHSYQSVHKVHSTLVNLCTQLPAFGKLVSNLAFIPETSQIMGKLDKFLNRTIPIDRLIPLQESDIIDENIFVTGLFLLTQIRPIPAESNYRDALNLALVHGMNTSACPKKHLYFMLVTHGHPYSAFSSIGWRDDPLTSEESFGPHGAARNLEYCIYDTLAEMLCPKLDHRIRFIDAALKQCGERTEHLRIMHRAFRKGQLPLLHINDILGDMPATALEIDQVEAWHPQLFEKYLSIVEAIDEGEKQFYEEKSKLDDKFSESGISIVERLLYGARTAPAELASEWSGLSSRIATVKRKIEEQLGSLMESDVRYYISSLESKREFSEFRLIELEKSAQINKMAIQDAASEEKVCSIDLGPFFFSMSCNTPPKRLEWFCRVASYLVTQAAIKNVQRPLRQVTKVPEGIVVLTTEDEVWQYERLQDFAFPLDANHLWCMVKSQCQGSPKFMRINTPYMDLWYECITQSSEEGRVGIISHLAMADLVAYLVARSQRRLVRISNLTDAVVEALGNKYPCYDEKPAEKARTKISKARAEQMIQDEWDKGTEEAQLYGLKFGRTPYYEERFKRWREHFYQLLEHDYIVED